MPVIPKPTSYLLDPKKDKDYRTTRLYFKERQSADFYLRGALAWPKSVPQDTGYQDIYYPGFVLLAGVNLTDPERPIWVFEDQEFRTIDNWIKPDGNIKENPAGGGWYGLAYFANKMMTEYGCKSYFYGDQTQETYDLYEKEMMESLNKAEGLLKYPISRTEVSTRYIGDQLISEYVSMGRLTANNNTRFSDLLRDFDNNNNAKHALKCLLAGFKAHPWIDMRMVRGYG